MHSGELNLYPLIHFMDVEFISNGKVRNFVEYLSVLIDNFKILNLAMTDKSGEVRGIAGEALEGMKE